MGKFFSDVVEIGSFGLIQDPLGIEAGEQAATQAAGVQAEASQAGIEEQRRQFDITQQQFEPFRQAGVSAIEQQRILLGLGGFTPAQQEDPDSARREELQGLIAQAQGQAKGGSGLIGGLINEARGGLLKELQSELGALAPAPVAQVGAQLSAQQQQAQAFETLAQSPGQQFLRDRAQKNLLRNAAALGGIGGGNVRSALVQQGVGFAQQDLQNQFARLGQLSGQGFGATTNVAQIGQQTGANVANLLGSQGAARASGILGKAQVGAQATGQLLQLGGQAFGALAPGSQAPRVV